MKKLHLILTGIALLIVHSIFIIYNGKDSVASLILSPVLTTAVGALLIYLLTGVDAYIKTKLEKEFDEGKEAYDKKNYSKAIQIWRPLAEKGYVEAQCKIGEMYEFGIGLVQDREEARAWYKKGAKKKHARSEARLGYLYSADKNYKEAKKWYERAANKGDPVGKNNLGLIYYQDLGGFGKDIKGAFRLFKEAAGLGYSSAQNNIGYYMHYEGSLNGKPDYKEAVKWFRQSAKQGDEMGQHNLGAMYLKGIGGLPESTFHAYKWLYLAKKNGHKEVQEWLDKAEQIMSEEEVAEAKVLAARCVESNYEDCGDPPDNE